jgi:cytoskeletal protein CcmA (bactofilin family)
VRANSITIAAGSRLKGSIYATMVIVDGDVEGMVKCMKLQVNTTGSVSGEIYHSILVVESGGKIDGKIVRQEKEQPAPTRLLADETPRNADPELAEIVSTYTRLGA